MPSIKTYTEIGGPASAARPANTKRTAKSLGAGVAEAITIPAGARFGVFKATADCWIDFTGNTAVVPAGDSDDSTVELLSAGTELWLHLDKSASLSIISTAGGLVSVSWYSA